MEQTEEIGNKEHIIISVESRKGGVGKTTAALNLSSLLLNRGYAVLLIDVDITGTNISTAVQSPFWRNIVNPIKHTINNKVRENVNLISLFENEFMVGDRIPSWSTSENRDYFIDNSKINILGSQIYNDTDSQHKYIIKPSILFDELHAHWLLEFLKEICRTFAEKFQKKAAIVLDNSPGFVGIAPVVHEWLTDIGPKRGKFLTVSSLDNQDLVSCAYSIDELHNQFCAKAKAALAFEKITQDETNKVQLDLDETSKDFFIRLVSQSVDSEIEQCYRLQINNIKEYIENPKKFQSLIINKVPKEIVRGAFSYELSRILNKFDRSSITEKILEGDDKLNLRNHFVIYDEYIEFQFYQPSLIKNESRYYREKSSYEIIDNYLINASERLPKLSNLFELNINEIFNSYQEISLNFLKYQSIVQEIIDRFDTYNRNNILKIINSEWYPEYPIKTVKKLLNEYLFSIDYPYESYDIFNENNKINMEFAFRFGEMFEQRFFRNNESVNEQMLRSLYIVILLSGQLSGKNPKYAEALLELFALVSVIQQNRWNKTQNINKKKEPITTFLAHEKLAGYDFRKEEIKDEYWKYAHKLRSHPEMIEAFFTDLYPACCYAQARILDINNDTNFLIKVLRDLIHTDHDEDILFPGVRDLLDNVIVNKTITHNESDFYAKKEILTASYMTNFKSVLSHAIKDWEI